MAAGKAILAPRQDNLLEVLTEGSDAVCFTPEDPGELETALRRLVSDEALRLRLGTEARRTIQRRGLTWDGNAAKIVQVAAELLAERTTPVCPHFGTCGGCHYQHAAYEAQIKFKIEILRETPRRFSAAR